nr:hypothetical protein [Actinocyclus sp. mgcode 4]
MQYKTSLYHSTKIKNLLNDQKLLFLVFFNSKKQKTNIKLNQKLLQQNFKIIKLKNRYIKNLFKFSIFFNLTFICSSFIYFGVNLNKNFDFINVQPIKIISIFFENNIYNAEQLSNVLSLNYESNIKNLYFFLIRLFFSIRLK